jgi:hypothetical protein
MDFGTAIIALMMSAIAILPFILVSRRKKNEEKRLLQSLQRLASQHSCAISHYECIRDFIVGIDEASNRLFYYKKTKDSEIARQLDLAGIRSCKVVNLGRSGEHKGIGKLELSFTPIAKDAPRVVWGFYDAEESLQLNSELQAANKWAKLVNERLAGKARPLAHAGVE